MRQKKSFKAVELKHLDEETINKIRQWRNSDFVRTKSLNQHIITPEEHKNFIEKLKQNPNRGLFVFYLDNEPFAVYHYSLNPETNSISGSNYLTDEDYHYLGYGEILHHFSRIIIFEFFKVDYEEGEILDTNKKFIATCQKYNTITGVLKNKVLINGEYHDIYQLKLSRDYYNSIPQTHISKIYRIVKEEPIENWLLF